MAEHELGDYNVVATYLDHHTARRAASDLHDEGVDAKKISYLAREAEQVESMAEAHEEVEEVPKEVGKKVAAGTAGGAAAGGAAGFLAGAIAFGIPGVGPAVGAGIWISALGGAVAGGTAGGVARGINQMWDARYRDAVAEGRALVGVHSNERDDVARSARILERRRPERLDRFDSKGRFVERF